MHGVSIEFHEGRFLLKVSFSRGGERGGSGLVLTRVTGFSWSLLRSRWVIGGNSS